MWLFYLFVETVKDSHTPIVFFSLIAFDWKQNSHRHCDWDRPKNLSLLNNSAIQRDLDNMTVTKRTEAMKDEDQADVRR